MKSRKRGYFFLRMSMLLAVLLAHPAAISATPPGAPGGPPPGMPPGGPGGNTAVKTQISVTEGEWSFDLVTTTSASEVTVSSTITYYAGKAESIVIVPAVLGGAPVTKIASQAFGHHSEIAAVYVPDSVTEIAEWAFYDLNEAVIISCANPAVSIDDAAFQSSANAQLYLPQGTLQTLAGGKSIATENTQQLSISVTGSSAAAIAGGSYLSVTYPIGYELTLADIAAISQSASHKAEDVIVDGKKVKFSGDAYVAKEQVVAIYKGFQGDVRADELDKRFRSVTESEARALNSAIEADASYSKVKSLLTFAAGYYLNGNPVRLSPEVAAYDVSTGEAVVADRPSGMLPSTGSGYYKYVAYRDTDRDGQIDLLYYSPYALSYSYNATEIVSKNKHLNGLSARDILNPRYLSFANAVLTAQGADDVVQQKTLTAATAKDGAPVEAASNEERSILWASDYGSIIIDELHADSTSVGNWAKMSYESALDSYNVEIVMEWGMNALLYATNGGMIRVGDLNGPRSSFFANGDGANGIIAGGSGAKTGSADAPYSTASVFLSNADLTLEGWNNHVADVVYGGYAYLERVKATTGIPGSYAVGQASALANDFGNGVVEVKDFHTTVYGNRSAGAYVIGGGIIAAENASFVSKMDAGLVSASGGTFDVSDSRVTGQIAFRNRGGINTESKSTFTKVAFTADKDVSGYTLGDIAATAVAAWSQASGDTALIHYMMSDPNITIGQLCRNYGISAADQAALLMTLSDLAGESYTADTPLRNSVLDNSYYNYSAGRYTGTTDFSEIPYLTTGSSFGGLSSSVFEFEASGITLELNNCTFANSNSADYNYLLASEAGSNPVVTFNHSDAAGLIWNEGDVLRAVEGRPGKRASAMKVVFAGSRFTGSFADGNNGLWKVKGLDYRDGSGNASSLNGNYYGASANWGITAIFDAQSTWIVERDSYLGTLIIEEGARIEAPAGNSVLMLVNGKQTSITPGSYSGEIILKVAEK